MNRSHPKTAVVTGAGSGIGRALAVALAGRRHRVGIVDIDEEGATETLGMLERGGGSGELYLCDVSDFDAVGQMADHFFELWGEVGLLANNAGIGAGGIVGEISIDDWKKTFGVNLFGVVNGCEAFVPRMKAQGAGHIVNTASTAGLVPVMGFAPYSSSKAAVVALSETLLMELAPFNIGVTVLCPSVVKTNIVENSLKVITIQESEDMAWGVELLGTGMERSTVTCEDVARMVLDAVDRNRLFVVTNRTNRSNWRYSRLSPERYFRASAWLHKRGFARGFMMRMARKGLI